MKHEPELFCESSSGIYIPQRFAMEVNRGLVDGVTEDDWNTLERGPETDWYWETWDKVLGSCTIESEGVTWYLWQDGDLWVVPEGYENDDFFGGMI